MKAKLGRLPFGTLIVLSVAIMVLAVIGVTVYNSINTSDKIILPIASPSVREGAASAYDAATRQLIMFGGVNTLGNALGGTWIFKGSSWAELKPEVSPSPRAFSSIAYDSSTKQLLLFGGEQRTTNSLVSLNDTWEWNGSNWIELHPQNSPSPRAASAMAEAPMSQNGIGGFGNGNLAKGQNSSHHHFALMLFGGIGSSNITLNDTWEWNGSNWIELHPQNSPSPRAASAMAEAPMSQNGIGGFGNGNLAKGQNSSHHHFALMLFGGLTSLNLVSGELGDTWEWNGSNWIELHPQNSPPPRAVSSISLAPINTNGNQNKKPHIRTLLFGGFGLGSKDLNDTWEWNGSNWIELHPQNSPSPRGASSVAILPSSKFVDSNSSEYSNKGNFDVVLFGGLEGPNSLNDTWKWNGTSWIRVLDPEVANPKLAGSSGSSSTTNPPPEPQPTTEQNAVGVNPLNPPSPMTTTTIVNSVPEPAASIGCTPDELSAKLTQLVGLGMGTSQLIITINSSSPCLLPAGYPNLEFILNNGSIYPVTIVDGNTLTKKSVAKTFAIGDGFMASFLLQQFGRGPNCSPSLPVMKMQIPGNSTWIPVQFWTETSIVSSWGECGGKVEVTPFEPNDSISQYQF